jgi:hypothetical protein
MILAVKIALKAMGFGRTIAWIRRQVAAVPKLRAVDSEIVKRTEHVVAIAAAVYPGRARCLEQSLVLYYVLRRQAVAVRFRMGVQAHPFLAHAWVESHEGPINDVAEHVSQFALLPDQLT